MEDLYCGERATKSMWKIALNWTIGTIVGICIISLLYTGCKETIKMNKETLYCGKVIKMFTTDPYQSGKSHYDGKAHIVFYNDSLRRNIFVTVSWNIYANTNIGEDICFKLSKNNLRQ